MAQPEIRGDVDAAAPAALRARLAYLLKRSQAMLGSAVDPALAAFDLDWRRLAVLLLLDEEGPLPQKGLSRRARIDRTTTVAIVDALEEAGYVERQRLADDRRSYAVVVTTAGRRALRAATRAYDRVEAAFLAPLPATERRRLKASLLTAIDAQETR